MKKGTLKKVLALCMAMAMVFSFAACGGTDSGNDGANNDNQEQKPILKVGTSADYPPYEFLKLNEKGEEEMVGMDIEMAKIIADKLGMELQLENMSFDGLLMSLAEGKYDMVIAGLTKDPARKVLFSDTYTSRAQMAIINAKDVDKFKTMEDFMGTKVAGQSGTVQQQLAEKLAGDSATAIQQFPDMIMMLKAGKIDAVLADTDVGGVYVAANEDLAAAPFEIPYENPDVCIAFQEGNQELCDKVNAALAEMKADGTLEKLQNDAIALAAEIEKANSEGSSAN